MWLYPLLAGCAPRLDLHLATTPLTVIAFGLGALLLVRWFRVCRGTANWPFDSQRAGSRI